MIFEFRYWKWYFLSIFNCFSFYLSSFMKWWNGLILINGKMVIEKSLCTPHSSLQKKIKKIIIRSRRILFFPRKILKGTLVGLVFKVNIPAPDTSNSGLDMACIYFTYFIITYFITLFLKQLNSCLLKVNQWQNGVRVGYKKIGQ